MIQFPNGEFEVWPENSSQVRAILDENGNKNLRGPQAIKNSMTPNPGVDIKEGIDSKGGNMALSSCNDDLRNGLATDKHHEESLTENLCDMGGVQNSYEPIMPSYEPIMPNEQNCVQGEIGESNAINDHGLLCGWNQSSMPLWCNAYDWQPQPSLVEYSDFDFNLDYDFGCMWSNFQQA